MKEEVIVNGQLHAIIVRNTHDEQGIQFFTPNEFSSEKNLWLNALHKLFKRTMSHTLNKPIITIGSFNRQNVIIQHSPDDLLILATGAAIQI
jgi:hypothetical protein